MLPLKNSQLTDEQLVPPAGVAVNAALPPSQIVDAPDAPTDGSAFTFTVADTQAVLPQSFSPLK